MKYYLVILAFISLPLLFFSCGILDSGGGNNPVYYSVKKKIYIINTSGSGLKFLTYGSNPKFSKDGNTIYFSQGDSLCSMEFNGSNRKVLFSSSQQIWDYSISNDGKFIAVSTFNNFYLINSIGSYSEQLASEPADKFDENESISSNDSLIIYQRYFGISIINSNGSNQKDIFTQDSAHEYFEPTFVLNNNGFIYTFRNYYDDWYIRFSNFNTTSFINIYSYNSFHDYTTGREEIKISPDDDILFATEASQNDKAFYIHQINLNSKKDKILTDGYDVNYSLDWNKITYLKPSDPSKSIYIYNLSSSGISAVRTNLPWANLFHPQLNNNNRILFEADSTYTESYY